jgi:hypothetical protein
MQFGTEKSTQSANHHVGIRKVVPLWHRLQSPNPKSPPKDLRPLWQLAQLVPPAEAKCCVAAGELTCLACGAPAVNL